MTVLVTAVTAPFAIFLLLSDKWVKQCLRGRLWWVSFFTLWTLSVGLVWYGDTEIAEPNLLELSTTAQTETEQAAILLKIAQNQSPYYSTSSPGIQLTHDVWPIGVTKELSVTVTNNGAVPVIVQGTMTITDSSQNLVLRDIPISARWKGSSAQKTVILPSSSEIIDVAAPGIGSGWKIPAFGRTGMRYCLHLETTYAAFANGFVSLLCQNDWRLIGIGLTNRGWVQIRLQVTAYSLANLQNGITQELMFTIRQGEWSTPDAVLLLASEQEATSEQEITGGRP